MASGCMCCKVRGDLIDGLKKLVQQISKQGQHLDGVIIELSGLSEVSPVVTTFFADSFVQRSFEVDAIVTMVDSDAALSQLSSGTPPDPLSKCFECSAEDQEDVASSEAPGETDNLLV